MRLLSTVTLLLLTAALIPNAGAGEWRQFRGNDSTGVSTERNLPAKFEPGKSEAWKVDLPGKGLSGPIIVGGKVFLTASSGYRDDRLHLLCFDEATGAKEWERQVYATGRTICHNSMCMATPQPVSDGQRVFATFSCNDVFCYDLDGHLLWYRGLGLDFPNASNSLGMSSSPVVVENTLVLQLDTDTESFVAGLDAETGETRWKIDRPRSSVWASPAVFRTDDGKLLVILQGKNGVVALRPQDGSTAWTFKQECSSIPSTTVADGLVLAPAKGLSALKPSSSSPAPALLWQENKLGPNNPTPIAYDGKVYVVKGSVLTCAELQTGKVVWQMRVKGTSFYSSPLAGNGILYLIDEPGTIQTVDITGKKGEITSTLPLGESVWCTPALVNSALYARSNKHLWKLVEAK
ncbi:MAG: PQQ-binding-like beta-propeller repeat protein [Planctomycetales bacterium]